MPSSILNSDDGVISGTAGLKNSGGDDAVLLIQTKGVTAQTVDAGQRTKFPTTIGVGGATPSTSGSGITFPATQSASTNANTLDDYEEGTWTPEYIPDAGSFGSATYLRVGNYQKIGKWVNCQGYIYLTGFSVGTASGLLYLGGLPFTSDTTSRQQAGSVGETHNWNTNSPDEININQNNTRAGLKRTDQGASPTSSVVITVSNLKNGNPACIMVFSLSYLTTA